MEFEILVGFLSIARTGSCNNFKLELSEKLQFAIPNLRLLHCDIN